MFQEAGIRDLLFAPAKVPRLPGLPPISGTRLINDNLSDLHAQVCVAVRVNTGWDLLFVDFFFICSASSHSLSGASRGCGFC